MSSRLQEKTIAVVVVCYNQGHFLADALDSVVAQTRPADEIILVDDGSVDETSHVANKYQNVRYIWQGNRGLSAARNTGLASTTSHFVLFLDSDDMLNPEALESALAAMLADPRCAFVYGGYRQVTTDRAEIATHNPISPCGAFDSLLRLGNYIAMHGTVLYNRTVLHDSGGFDPSLYSCEDYDVYLRLARHHYIGTYATIAADYRCYSGSMSGKALKMAASARAVISRHAHTTSERLLSRKGIAVMTRFYALRYWSSVNQNLRGCRIGSAFRNLSDLIGMPLLWRPFLTVAISHLIALGGRKITRHLRETPAPPL